MPPREPMWFCHECHAEMRPLMVPDPHCASCNGTFVEKIEDEQDDPRAFQEAGPAWDDGTVPGEENLEWFTNLMQLLGNPEPASRTVPASSLPHQRSSSFSAGQTGGGMRFEISRTGPGGSMRSFVVGGPNTLGGQPRTNRPEGNIAGTLMAQYLLSMLNQRAGGNHEDPFGSMFGIGPEDGRWGDYVFNQEALDQIVTQLMENSSASGPVPASEELLNRLDREVLEENSPLLERDCAVCKEQFSLTVDDPDELVVVRLPCKHPFHESCITPWLKTSATCPVCRHQLVPQSNHDHPPSSRPGSPRNRSSPHASSQAGSSSGSGTANASGGPGGIFGPLFNILSGGHNRQDSTHNNSNQPSSSHPQRRGSHDDVPGGWAD
ncbi:hypothetical protein K488DRAFT_46467 [Vararia minispora EC-137]|uniref:Uncharacterized protein n=1 Tax=Vararia minispora EC-137 TaxID=1314806 RepID=A0ACB8QR40_9AGAM|nr:hypothetical protein K488DRAFT_46467 [Vararia minispora EC-137]